MVHINKKYYNNVTAALAKPDGLAVVGIMFVVGGSESEYPEANFSPLEVCERIRSCQ